MPVFLLSNDIAFPSPQHARRDGLLAVGGDLSYRRLLKAYAMGIFPWFSRNEPIMWWSPDPRTVLYPTEIHISRSLRKTLRQQRFRITFDSAFSAVVKACARAPRRGNPGTWIVPQMIEAYVRLHDCGLAHSIEVWADKMLVGGLYGVALGRCFFGESMFSQASNASKVALVTLAQRLKKKDYALIDCQVYSAHLVRMGAREVPRAVFLDQLAKALQFPVLQDKWRSESP